jgi:Txe/YoeB family toxin of Txe-Axe toxin-antitoxin module
VNLVFSREAWEEYLYWQQTHPEILKRINELIKKRCAICIVVSASPSHSNTHFKATGRVELQASTAVYIASFEAICGLRKCATITEA